LKTTTLPLRDLLYRSFKRLFDLPQAVLPRAAFAIVDGDKLSYEHLDRQRLS
jgi:hypothetical protein